MWYFLLYSDGISIICTAISLLYYSHSSTYYIYIYESSKALSIFHFTDVELHRAELHMKQRFLLKLLSFFPFNAYLSTSFINYILSYYYYKYLCKHC